MLACYMEVKNEKIDSMKSMNSDDLIYAIAEISEEGSQKTFELEDMCDGLHFLLTKVSALNPIRGNLLSEAIVGSETFAGEDVTDKVSYVDFTTAHDILNSLEELDFDAILKEFDPNEFADNDIYPNMWLKEKKAELQNELLEAFSSLKQFYSEITANDSGLIACVV